MNTPKIDTVVAMLAAGGEPSDSRVGAAIGEGVQLLVQGVKALDRIATALEARNNPDQMG